MAFPFYDVRLIGWDTPKRTGRARCGDAAFIAIQTAIMPDLQKERTIAKSITALNALAATDTQFVVDSVFIIGVFDKSPNNRTGGTELIFRTGIERFRLRLKIAGTQITVAAHGKGMYTFNGRLFLDTISSAVATGYTLIRINLPDMV